MRKDFLIDPYQVMEGRAAGAGGVLVIVRMLDQSRITALLDCAAMLKMFVLLEAFDAADLDAAREVLAQRRGHDEQILVGLNCRDLDKLTVELSRLSELADSMPPGFAPVAESGVNTLNDVGTIVRLGYRVALIGTTLMNSPQPRELLGKMLSTGRQTAMSMATRKLRIAKGEVREE
jgi:indole-3-glycerol phosphate synthase